MWVFTLCNNIVRFGDKVMGKEQYIPHGKMSKGEKAVYAVLKKHNIPFEMQYELGYYVHADFAIHCNDKLYLVEYDGRQHYHPVKFFGGRWTFFLQRMRDTIEGWECKNRGIPLLRIRYDLPFENIENVLMDFIGSIR